MTVHLKKFCAEIIAQKLKIILLGDAASGKSKLMERYLLDDYHPERLSTQAVNIFHYNTTGSVIDSHFASLL